MNTYPLAELGAKHDYSSITATRTLQLAHRQLQKTAPTHRQLLIGTSQKASKKTDTLPTCIGLKKFNGSDVQYV